TSGADAVLSRPAGAQPGDLLLAQVRLGGGGIVSVPAGWEEVAAADTAGLTHRVYARTAAAGDPATWTWGGVGSIPNPGGGIIALTGASVDGAVTQTAHEAVHGIGVPGVTPDPDALVLAFSACTNVNEIDSPWAAGTGRPVWGLPEWR